MEITFILFMSILIIVSYFIGKNNGYSDGYNKGYEDSDKGLEKGITAP